MSFVADHPLELTRLSNVSRRNVTVSVDDGLEADVQALRGVAGQDELPPLPVARRCPLAPAPELGEVRGSGSLSRVRLPDGESAWVVSSYELAREILAKEAEDGAQAREHA